MSSNPITLEALQILDAIERRGSFAKAAEELNKATSALSYGVQKLEEQLNITVFERQGRRSVLTPAGRYILEEGRKILNAASSLADKAKEVATGWEPRLRIAVESILNYDLFFKILENFLSDHESLEVDVCECVLNGGWEALERDVVDLIVGASGPVPLQKGFRVLSLGSNDLLPVIASHHPLAYLANIPASLAVELPSLRRVVTHDTSTVNVVRNAGLSVGASHYLYVQTIDQKIAALLAGLGIGSLPRHRVQHHLDSGRLVELSLETPVAESYIAWKISNKGRALQSIARNLAAAKW
ncbi:MAG: DNA-binding transcriptional LysR family regulator [Oceanicoccus sp.]|jgi:DNA-binding transcriptional LysR family regulator